MADKLTVKYFARQEVLAELSEDKQKYIIDLCMNLGLISSSYECPECGKNMALIKGGGIRSNYQWLCRTKRSPSHHTTRSVMRGSWFEKTRKCMLDLLMMVEFFVSERSQKDVGNVMNFTSNTVRDWRQSFREVCFDVCVIESVPIGGFGAEVELDECKFGKRMYNRIKRIDEKWVFSGVERGSSRHFLKVVDTKDKETLLEIIKTFILPGTTIYSDCWKSYGALEDESFEHVRVHHSLTFKDPETTDGTNAVDEKWSAIRRKLPTRIVKDYFVFYLAEHLWRRSHANSEDLMRTFLEGVKKVYPPKEKD